MKFYDGDLGTHFDEMETIEEEVPVSNALEAGSVFLTKNRKVAKLPVGTLLSVVGKGELEVVEVPQLSFEPGDRILSNYGPATVVRKSVMIDISNFDDGELLYVADADPVVRRVFANAVTAL